MKKLINVLTAMTMVLALAMMVPSGSRGVQSSVAMEGYELFVSAGNIWPERFTEPFETVYYQFRDGTIIGFSTHEEAAIRGPIQFQIEALKVMGYHIEDAIVEIHNHNLPFGFSTTDLSSMTTLRKKGFVGLFGLYYPTTRSFLWSK